MATLPPVAEPVTVSDPVDTAAPAAVPPDPPIHDPIVAVPVPTRIPFAPLLPPLPPVQRPLTVIVPLDAFCTPCDDDPVPAVQFPVMLMTPVDVL